MVQNSYKPHILIERGSYITHCGYSGRDKTELSFRTPSISVEAQFKHIFEEVLKVNPAQHNVVIVKDAGTAQQILRDEAHLLFTKFHVKACAFINAQIGINSCYAIWESHSVIIDIGYESTYIFPFIKFISQKEYMAEIPMAGRAIEQFIIGHLIKHGIEKGIIEKNREQLFPYLMRDYFYFDSESEHDFEREAIETRKKKLPKYLTLQDKEGKSFELSLPSPVLPPDLIISFSKEINNHIIKILETFGSDYLGSLYEYFDTVKWVPRIIIIGGASNILGLRSLLIRELLKSTELIRYTGCERKPSSPLVDIELRGDVFTIRNATPEDSNGTWVGASMLSSLNTFNKCFVLKETYQNNSDIFFPLDHTKNLYSDFLKK